MKEIGLRHKKVNLYQEACALGHPIGASGARALWSLYSDIQLQKNNLQRSIGRGGNNSHCN